MDSGRKKVFHSRDAGTKVLKSSRRGAETQRFKTQRLFYTLPETYNDSRKDAETQRFNKTLAKTQRSKSFIRLVKKQRIKEYRFTEVQ